MRSSLLCDMMSTRSEEPRPFPASLSMAPPLTIRHVSDHEGSSSSEQSDSEPDTSSNLSASESLDSQGSRKRRKLSPVEDDDDEPFVPRLSVPSRAARGQHDAVSEHPTINGTILAPTDPQTTFVALGVKPWLVGSLGSMAIRRPTGIQKHCIPAILKGRDCIGGSRTGSGKTMAFAVPILQKWAEDPFGIFALVLTPTRYDSNDDHGPRVE